VVIAFRKFCIPFTCFLLILTSQIAAQMNQIPGGFFKMGSSSGDADERPEHTVKISAFRMDSHEITNAQYDSCVNSGKCSPAHYDDNQCLIWNGSEFKKIAIQKSWREPNKPVVCITWKQAQNYCRNRGMRLPTEAQWEYAAQAGAQKSYSWGNSLPSTDRCAYSKAGMHAVGTFEPNEWGLYDMTGNVWEWTSSHLLPYPFHLDPTPEEQNIQRRGYVVRGGAWYYSKKLARCSAREVYLPDYVSGALGFRIAMSI